MENFNSQEYINALIDNFNKYDYYTNNQNIISSLQNLNNVTTNADLLSCLKKLNDENLVYQFLHKKSYINSATKEVSTNFDTTFGRLLADLEKTPTKLLEKPIDVSIKNSISNISYLLIIEKTLDYDSINESINLAKNIFKNISIDNLHYPIMFNDKKKLHDASDYYGRFSRNEGMIEIPKVDNIFKPSALTHESFHAIDSYIFHHLTNKYGEIEAYSKEFTSLISEINGYDNELLEILNIPLDKIKNDFKDFFEFCNNFDNIPLTNKLSKDDTKEYIEKYLNIDITKYKSESDFTQQILELYSNEKNKLPKENLTNISDNTDKITSLSKDIFNYYHDGNTNKSMYSLMSNLISNIASEKDGYRSNLNEKCARIFEMNSYSKENNDIYKLLPNSLSEKNIYPVGNEREFYVNSLNKELKNLSELLNQHVHISNPLPKPPQELVIPKGFENDSSSNYDIAKFSKQNVISNFLKIRELQNNNEIKNKLKI